MKRILLLLLLWPSLAWATAAPVCLYQDNLSGPAVSTNGNSEGGNGTYIDLFGLNFAGASVTANGTPVAQVIYNGVDATGDRSELGVQIASTTSGTGAVQVTTGAGTCQYSTAAITSVAVAGGVGTFAYTGAQLLAGQSLFVQGLTTAAGLQIDGTYVTVLATGLTSSSFEARTPLASNQSTTSDSGTASNGGFTVHTGGIYYVGPGTNNSSASGYSCPTLKSTNSYTAPWLVANNPTGTLNYDLAAALLVNAPGNGYTASVLVTAYSYSSGTLTLTAQNHFNIGDTALFYVSSGALSALNGLSYTVLSSGLSTSQFEITESTVTGSGSATAYVNQVQIGSCGISGSGWIAYLQDVSAGELETFSSFFSVGSGYMVGDTCNVTQPGNAAATGGTVKVWGYPVESYTYSQRYTPRTYAGCLSAGDTLVFLDGFSSQYGDGTNNKTALLPPTSGTSADPITYMARPGGTVTLGGKDTVNYGIRNSSYVSFNNFFGLTAYGSQTSGGAFNLNGPGSNNYIRAIGNTAFCPDCYSSAAAFSAGQNAGAEGTTSVYIDVLGNYVTNASCSLPAGVVAIGAPAGVSNKQYHDFYLVGDNVEFGWNRVANSCAFNGMQINYGSDNETVGFTNFSGHDNDISEANGACFNYATVDPSRGYVLAFNNILHHCGIQEAGDSIGAPINHACFASPAYGASASAAFIQVYNNTLYDCSSIQNTISTAQGCYKFSGASQPNLEANIVNNICYQPTYTDALSNTVWTNNSGGSTITGSNDLFYYGGGTPGNTNTSLSAFGTDGMLNTDPQFTSATDGPWTNFNLQSISVAVAAGSTSIYTDTDFAGNTRPTMPSIGALEYQTYYPYYTLSTATAGNGSGTVNGALCAGSYLSGSSYSCTATAASGSIFNSWSSTCGGSASGATYSGTMPSNDCTVTAMFSVPSFSGAQLYGVTLQ